MNPREELAAVVQSEALGVTPMSDDLLRIRVNELIRRVNALEKQVAEHQRQFRDRLAEMKTAQAA